VRVWDKNGSREAVGDSELEGYFSRKGDTRADEFWIFFGSEDFPSLAVLIWGELTVLHYYPERKHPGFISHGDPRVWNLAPVGVTVFPMVATGERQEVPNWAIVSSLHALQAAKEFSLSGNLPRSVEWSEL